jgi:hypothetical protein
MKDPPDAYHGAFNNRLPISKVESAPVAEHFKGKTNLKKAKAFRCFEWLSRSMYG